MNSLQHSFLFLHTFKYPDSSDQLRRSLYHCDYCMLGVAVRVRYNAAIAEYPQRTPGFDLPCAMSLNAMHFCRFAMQS